MVEEWKPIQSLLSRYEASSLGRIRSVKSGQIRKPQPNKKTHYHYMVFYLDGVFVGRQVHRLVLEAFRGGRTPETITRHLNGDLNDNRLENLAWGTLSENFMDALSHGTATVGEKNGMAKLTQDQADEIRQRQATGELGKNLAEEFGISQATVSRIKHGVRYG